MRYQGKIYRLVGFDTPERDNQARCDDERRRGEAATKRLRELIASGEPRLQRVACPCRPDEEAPRAATMAGFAACSASTAVMLASS